MWSTAQSFQFSRPIVRPAVLLLICWTGSFAASRLAADEPSAKPVVPEVAAENAMDHTAPVAAEPAPTTTLKVTDRQRKAYLGLFALVGIAIAGLALLALTMLWARRLRRQFRQPIPECELPARDFWFLKPAKPMVTESSLPDSHLPLHEPPPTE